MMSLSVNTQTMPGITFGGMPSRPPVSLDSKTKELPGVVNPSKSLPATVKKGWKDYSIEKINYCEARLDKWLPNMMIQVLFDMTFDDINDFNLPSTLNHWLNTNAHGNWLQQLSTYLAKLPVRVAISVFRPLSALIKFILIAPSYVLVHPMKVPLQIAKAFVRLIDALTSPEVWTRSGMRIFGVTLCSSTTAVINPFGPIAIGIAGALAVAGLTVGTLMTARDSDEGARDKNIRAYLLSQVEKIPEEIMVGYCRLLIIDKVIKVLEQPK